MALKIITINISEIYLDCIEVLKQLGKIPSRSEGIRKAIALFLVNERQFNHDLIPEHFKERKLEEYLTCV